MIVEKGERGECSGRSSVYYRASSASGNVSPPYVQVLGFDLHRDASEIVLETFDVVFAQVAAPLDLDKNKIFRSYILAPMRGANRDIDDLSCGKHDIRAIERDFGLSC